MRITIVDIFEILAGEMGVVEILNDYSFQEKMDIAAKHEEVILESKFQTLSDGLERLETLRN